MKIIAILLSLLCFILALLYYNQNNPKRRNFLKFTMLVAGLALLLTIIRGH
jgi:hypothetical protein